MLYSKVKSNYVEFIALAMCRPGCLYSSEVDIIRRQFVQLTFVKHAYHIMLGYFGVYE